jgi:serine/threonine-protein kinase HipA
MRKAEIKVHEQTAGWLAQDENGYYFKYDPAWLASKKQNR